MLSTSNLRAVQSYIAVTVVLAVVAGGLLKVPPFTREERVAEYTHPHRVSLIVPDLEETVRWYEETLGFVPQSVVSRGGGLVHVLLIRDSNVLELISGGGSLGPARASFPESTIEIPRIPLVLEDASVEIDKLRELGIEISQEPGLSSRQGTPVGVFRDLNGHVIELHDRL